MSFEITYGLFFFLFSKLSNCDDSVVVAVMKFCWADPLGQDSRVPTR